MDTMTTEALKGWYLFTFSLGLWTCIHLIANKQGDRQVKLCLLTFVALLIIPTANAYFTLVNGQAFNILQVISQNLTLAYGPILFCTIKQILLRPAEFKKDSWHFLPFFVLLIDRLSGSAIFDGLALMLFIGVQIFSYLGWSLYTLKKYKIQLLKLTQQHKNSSYYWLIFLALGLTAVMLIDLSVWIYMVALHKYPNLLMLSLTASLLSLYSNAIAFFALLQPKVFMHDKLSNEDSPKEKNNIELSTKKSRELRKVELSPDVAKQLDDQLQQLIEEHKPHLDDNISLGKLAALMGISRNQLSELLNIHKQISFYDFLNDLRCQESLALISSDNHNLSIIDIAYRSGFNNRNSFYTVFKKRTGLTPSQYKKQLHSS